MANTSPKAQRPAENKDVTSSAKPTGTFRFGDVSAAVFTKQVETRDGKSVNAVNVSLRRSYRDASGDWQHTHSLRAGDLLPAAYALIKCYEMVSDANGRDDQERQ